MSQPCRGDIWTVDLDPTRGHEQGDCPNFRVSENGTVPFDAGEQVQCRPALIVSVDLFNQGPADLVVVLPITSKAKGIPLHVRVAPPEGGVQEPSYIKCEDIRSVSKQRLAKFWGRVSSQTMLEIEERLSVLLGMVM
jgi:mRNA interferase MazF